VNAKSTLSIEGCGGVGTGQSTRQLASILVLIASLLALLLILHTHYGPFHVRSPFQSGLPLEAVQAERVARLAPPVTALSPAEERRYRALSEHLGKRYRVSQQVMFELVTLAHRVGRQHKLDPLLIIAMMGIESSFNPIAESVMGAKGLMQIIPHYHAEKLEPFGGEKAVFDPATNVVVGAQILKEYLRGTGNLNVALQRYAGALRDSDDVYTRKVLAERQLLHGVLARWSAPVFTARGDSERTALADSTRSARFR